MKQLFKDPEQKQCKRPGRWSLARANSVRDIGWIVDDKGVRVNKHKMSLRGLKSIVDTHNKLMDWKES